MRNVLIFTLLAVFSLVSLAEHHKGDHDGQKASPIMGRHD